MSIEKQEFEEAVTRLQNELVKLRTGRANPALLEDLKIDYYGQVMKIDQLASVSVPEARQLLIQPWDKNALGPIESAIQKSDLGLTPNNEGERIRIVLPQLNEERRKDLAKLTSRMGEEARVKIRNAREEIWKDIQKQEQAGAISEDDKFDLKEELQKIVDEFNERIKQITEKKEQEIMTV